MHAPRELQEWAQSVPEKLADVTAVDWSKDQPADDWQALADAIASRERIAATAARDQAFGLLRDLSATSTWKKLRDRLPSWGGAQESDARAAVTAARDALPSGEPGTDEWVRAINRSLGSVNAALQIFRASNADPEVNASTQVIALLARADRAASHALRRPEIIAAPAPEKTPLSDDEATPKDRTWVWVVGGLLLLAALDDDDDTDDDE